MLEKQWRNDFIDNGERFKEWQFLIKKSNICLEIKVIIVYITIKKSIFKVSCTCRKETEIDSYILRMKTTIQY